MNYDQGYVLINERVYRLVQSFDDEYNLFDGELNVLDFFNLNFFIFFSFIVKVQKIYGILDFQSSMNLYESMDGKLVIFEIENSNYFEEESIMDESSLEVLKEESKMLNNIISIFKRLGRKCMRIRYNDFVDSGEIVVK